MTRFLSRTSPGIRPLTPFLRCITPAGDADAARTAALTRPRAINAIEIVMLNVTNTATLTLSDLLHIVGGARNDLIQPLPAADDGGEQ